MRRRERSRFCKETITQKVIIGYRVLLCNYLNVSKCFRGQMSPPVGSRRSDRQSASLVLGSTSLSRLFILLVTIVVLQISFSSPNLTALSLSTRPGTLHSDQMRLAEYPLIRHLAVSERSAAAGYDVLTKLDSLIRQVNFKSNGRGGTPLRQLTISETQYYDNEFLKLFESEIL